ncbi:MAG: flagellar motor protein MotB [Proteobacteria bacterium]|nr:flagellar motor protein MotB [Pseudomonadota bacterium]
MAGDAKKLQPIIVKKVKKGGHGAHGGAWKIAYADFVTAMMAFFLLMWLLGSTTDGDKKGLADYFGSPLKIAMQGGSGAGDASHVIKGGGQDFTRSAGQVKRGDVPAPPRTLNLAALKAEQQRAEAARLQDLKTSIETQLSNDARIKDLAGQIRLDMTRDGLRIQIVDEGNRPLFPSGSAQPLPYTRHILQAIAPALADVPNLLTLEGHTDATPFSAGEGGYSNWELSADRANAARRELMAAGVAPKRVLRVQGLADSQPLDNEAPDAPRNRRISIVVMNRDAEDRVFRTAPEPQTESAAADNEPSPSKDPSHDQPR